MNFIGTLLWLAPLSWRMKVKIASRLGREVKYDEATFTDRKKAAAYIRQVRQYAPQHLTRLTIVHS